MYQTLSLNDFLTLAKTSTRVAVYHEMSADRLTPIGIVENLKNEMQDGAILESGLHHHDSGRYSYIAFGSIAQLCVQNNVVTQRADNKTTAHPGEPCRVLRELLAQQACVSNNQQVDFIHGAVGFITYDAVRLFEPIPDRHVSDNPLPEMLFNVYQTILMFDHLQQKLLISMSVDVNSNPEETFHHAQEKITALITKMNRSSYPDDEYKPSKQGLDSQEDVDISDENFIELVERAKHYIELGDAFQIVLSRRFTKRYTAKPFDIYRTLRRISPAPYMFYLPNQYGVILGAAPEKLINIRNRHVTINPIAGTRLRTETSNHGSITADLLSDQKELAEHMMVVDLARNDLGAICKPGSIQVDELLHVKHFSHVSHISAEISGTLCDHFDAFDPLAAAFPAGTLSGAPKIRAMQLIDELETSKRGMYGGAICRLDFQGNLDSCIAIRMATLRDGVATVRAGAGIVYDSNPIAEARETRQKAKSVLDAIAFAEESLS